MRSDQTIVGRKQKVILVEFDTFCLDAYKKSLTPVAVMQTPTDVDEALYVVIHEFKQGTLLVLGGFVNHMPDMLNILDMAKQIAKDNRFYPVIVANTGNEELNRKLLDKGCTHSVLKKSDLLTFLQSFGKSKSERSLRAIGMR